MGHSTSNDTKRVTELLAVIARYRVLLVGDGIIDEYCYVAPLNKSPKENIISNRYLRSEAFRGGVWAGARHVKNFAADVTIYSGPRVILKRRFVDEIRIRKMYEIHVDAQNGQPEEFPDPADFDLVIVADFGHGCVTPTVIEQLTERAKFLAVNAQTNSANYGFNLITKYQRADLVVLDRLEARLATHDANSPLESVIRSLGFPRVIVTCGPEGSVGFDRGEFHREPALSQNVIDTMGAGDAFLCLAALFAKAGASLPELLRVGNIAGAIKCGIVGHREAVTREAFLSTLYNAGFSDRRPDLPAG